MADHPAPPPRRSHLTRPGARRRLLAVLLAAVLALAGTAGLTGPAVAAVPNAGLPAAPASPFGPDVYVFSPSMPQQQIQQTVDAIAAQQVGNQFGTERYALLFLPGTYGSAADPLTFQVGYYTEVAGLGVSPTDVVIHGSVDVYNQCDENGCLALNNFWRSLSNLTIDIAGGHGCRADTEFWAVSQASPMRRVNITGGNATLMDYCTAGPQYASGGFIADSSFAGGTVINGSQQQFLVRNSALDGWSNGVWNQVFMGDTGAPATNFGANGGTYTTLDRTPVSRDRPYLYADPGGNYRVSVPAALTHSVGVSWRSGTAGHSLSLRSFFIATPRTPFGRINAALRSGRNLLLTPGVYALPHALTVTRANQVVLGLGFPTLVPQRGNDAVDIADVSGVSLSGLIVDAGPRRSNVLVRIGAGHATGPRASRGRRSDAGNPTSLFDVFFRIGGATPGRARTALVVNSSDVLLDDTWIWRADHGADVGWTDNTADTGLVVNGSRVHAYGLAVEHFQRTEVIWNGAHGVDVFFQNEMPYDPPSQQAWMAGPRTLGYPAFRLTARSFHGYGMGSYSYFNQGVDIHATQAFQVPHSPGVSMTSLLTVFLNGSGGIDSVINGVGAPVYESVDHVSTVAQYP